ncbi:MAG: hypothetical protein ABID45_03045, partial [Patescibacteria group bacterium]
PRRFLAMLHFPAELISGFFLYYLFKNKKIFLFGLLTALIVVVGIGNYINSFQKIEFDLDWQYFEATNWAKDNLDKDKKIISDVLTTIQFTELTGMQSGFTFPRIKDHMHNNKNEVVKTVFYQSDIQKAVDLLKDQNIKYVVVDTHVSPFWTPGYYKKFNNETYFLKIYSQKRENGREIAIYEVR